MPVHMTKRVPLDERDAQRGQRCPEQPLMARLQTLDRPRDVLRRARHNADSKPTQHANDHREDRLSPVPFEVQANPYTAQYPIRASERWGQTGASPAADPRGSPSPAIGTSVRATHPTAAAVLVGKPDSTTPPPQRRRCWRRACPESA